MLLLQHTPTPGFYFTGGVLDTPQKCHPRGNSPSRGSGEGLPFLLDSTRYGALSGHDVPFRCVCMCVYVCAPTHSKTSFPHRLFVLSQPPFLAATSWTPISKRRPINSHLGNVTVCNYWRLRTSTPHFVDCHPRSGWDVSRLGRLLQGAVHGPSGEGVGWLVHPVRWGTWWWECGL